MSNDALHAVLKDLVDDIEKEADVLREVLEKKGPDLTSDNMTDRLTASAAIGSMVSKLYTKTEDIFEKIAKYIDQERVESGGWHADLLRQMKVETDDRPAFIAADTFAVFDELMRFRHVERNAYASELRPAELPGKVRRALEAVDLLKRDFAEFSAAYFDIKDESAPPRRP